MQKQKRLVAVGQHRSEYPEPITFTKGAGLIIGDKHEGPEGWDNWYFCTVTGQPGGWVPGQLIEWGDDIRIGTAKEDYTARELEVNEGDELAAGRALNGWIWCKRLSDNQSGWVPAAILQNIEPDAQVEEV